MKQYFATSLLFFYVKGSLEIDEHFVKTGLRNTILFGLVPAGRNDSSIPLDNINAVNVRAAYSLIRILLGIVITILSFLIFLDFLMTPDFTSALIALGFVAFGVNLFDSGFIIYLDINLNANTTFWRVPFFEKKKLVAFKEQIEIAIRRNMESRNVEKATEKQTASLQQSSEKQIEILSNIAESLSSEKTSE